MILDESNQPDEIAAVACLYCPVAAAIIPTTAATVVAVVVVVVVIVIIIVIVGATLLSLLVVCVRRYYCRWVGFFKHHRYECCWYLLLPAIENKQSHAHSILFSCF